MPPKGSPTSTSTNDSAKIINGGSGSRDISSSVQSRHGGVRKRQYKGVRMRSWGSWVSEIRAPNQKTRIWLGSYSTAEAAARAYDAALLCLKGSSAELNFPSAAPAYCHHLPDAALMSPKYIQRVAAAAAAAANAVVGASTEPHPPSPDSPPLQHPSPPPTSTPSTSSSETTTTTEDAQAPGPCPSGDTASMTTVEDMLMDTYRLAELLSTDFGAFSSPKLGDQFAPSQMVEWEEEGDISLWSF